MSFPQSAHLSLPDLGGVVGLGVGPGASAGGVSFAAVNGIEVASLDMLIASLDSG